MHKLTAFVTLLAAAIISPLASAKVTEAEKSANAEAMERGRLLYRYDQAAWHSRIQAYIMSASKTAGVFPLGGHYRFTIGPDGKVESWRPFLKSCMIIDTRPEGEMQQKTAFFVSHVLDSQPTEIHYFARYNVPVDIAVMTTDGDIWMLGVDGFTNPKDSEIKLP